MKTLGRFTLFQLWAIILIGVGAKSANVRANPLDAWTTNRIVTNISMYCVTYGSNRFVAYGEYGDSGVILSSENGQDWSMRQNGGLTWAVKLVFAGGKFFCVGGGWIIGRFL